MRPRSAPTANPFSTQGTIASTPSRLAARIAIRGLLIAGFGAALAGCNTTYVSSDPTEGIPLAYQDRHPITVQEGRKALVLFVGSGRGGLSPTQRAEVLAFARNWQRDGTGGVTVDRPIQGGNERAISDTLRETLSILSQAGVPRNGIGIRPYDPHGRVATLRLTYPLMKALGLPAGDLRKPLTNLEGEALAKGLRIVAELGLDKRYGYKLKPLAAVAA